MWKNFEAVVPRKTNTYYRYLLVCCISIWSLQKM